VVPPRRPPKTPLCELGKPRVRLSPRIIIAQRPEPARVCRLPRIARAPACDDPKKRAPRPGLNQQSNEADKQRATKDHGPVPDIETEKPAVRRHKFELHERPLLGVCSQPSLSGKSLRNSSAHGAVLLLPAQKFENVTISCIRRRGGYSEVGAPVGYCESLG
jgi:hypothetical protein